MIPFRLCLCFIITQMLSLSQPGHSLVMLTANSKDVGNIARQFLSESLSNKLAAFIANTNKNTDNIDDTHKQPIKNNIEDSNDIEYTKIKDRSEDDDSNEHIKRAVQQNDRTPARTTHKMLEPFETDPEFKRNNTDTESNRNLIKNKILKDVKNYNYKPKPKYSPGDVEDLKRELIKVDMHYHKPNVGKRIKTKLEPIPEGTEENVEPDGDTREDKAKITHNIQHSKEHSYKNSIYKNKIDLGDNSVTSLYLSESRTIKNKIETVSLDKRDDKETKVEKQITEKSQALPKRPKLRQPNLKLKKRYQNLKESLNNQKNINKITKSKRFKKVSPAEEYDTKQSEKMIKNPNWSEEPEPQEKKQLKRKQKSKKSILRDQLKLRYYPQHNYYYPIKPKVVPGKAEKIETQETKTANEDKISNKDVKLSELVSNDPDIKPKQLMKEIREEHEIMSHKHETMKAKLTHDDSHIVHGNIDSSESFKSDTPQKELKKQHESNNVETNSKVSKYVDSDLKKYFRNQESIEYVKPLDNIERESDKNIVALFLTTKIPTRFHDDNNNVPNTNDDDDTTESLERRVTTPKEGKIMGTRSTVYHGAMEKDASWEKLDKIHQQHKNKEKHETKKPLFIIRDVFKKGIKKNNAYYHDEKDSIYHKEEKPKNIGNNKDYDTKHHQDRYSQEINVKAKDDDNELQKRKIQGSHENIKQEKKEKIFSEEEKDINHKDKQKIKKQKVIEVSSVSEEEDKAVTRGIQATSDNLKLALTSNGNKNEALWKRIEKQMSKGKRVRE